MIERVRAAVEAAVAEHRAGLTSAFGWTQVDVAVQMDAQGRALTLVGEVALPGVLAGLERRLEGLVPDGWRLDVAGVRARPGLGWGRLGPGVTRLWRAPGLSVDNNVNDSGIWDIGAEEVSPGTCTMRQVGARGELTSELVAGDGAVRVLATFKGGWSLVRAEDGTVGWALGAWVVSAGPVGPLNNNNNSRRGARREAGLALARWEARLRGYVGAPYRLGGTTRGQMDCSGLVQRCAREALGLVLPRHSTDQLRLAAGPGRALGEPGDLLFMTGVDAAACHVGVVLRGAGPGARTVVHASSRRGRVVEEPLDRCLARASGVRHMELEQVLELA